MPLVQVKVPYQHGYDYGIGADSVTGSPMGKVVAGAATGVEDAPGATTTYEITRILTTSELETKLGINVEASYGSASFGAGISARFGFSQSAKIQSSSLFLAITANIELAFHSIDEPTLTDTAAQLVGNQAAFAARYGNMFVRGIGRGGLFVAVMRIDTSSTEESTAISAELEGAYGLFSASAKTKFENLQRQYHNSVDIKLYHEGGPIDLAMDDPHDPLQFYELLQQWLKAFQDHPDQYAVPYFVTLAPIAIANGPLPPNEADIQHAHDILVLCAKQRSKILDGLNLMEYIIQHAANYDFPAPTTLESIIAASAGYQADLDLVARTASQAINDVSKAVTPAEFAREQGENYPKGLPPAPMPTLKHGVPAPTVLPNLVGLTLAAARTKAAEIGVSLDFLQPQARQDYLGLVMNEVGGATGIEIVRRGYRADQLVVATQEPGGGEVVEPGTVIDISVRVA